MRQLQIEIHDTGTRVPFSEFVYDIFVKPTIIMLITTSLFLIIPLFWQSTTTAFEVRLSHWRVFLTFKEFIKLSQWRLYTQIILVAIMF